MSKNLCGKTRDRANPYEVWQTADGSWTWNVLKKYKSEESEAKDQYARWFCLVTSPIVPEGEYGDVYVQEIKTYARRIK